MSIYRIYFLYIILTEFKIKVFIFLCCRKKLQQVLKENINILKLYVIYNAYIGLYNKSIARDNRVMDGGKIKKGRDQH
ncbi:hypothetical protein SAMN04487752_0910 [Carnobacterium viridans]|uniref:Uncharacterized protein n=1 Tax=Carnobacterium viridans TaxID=174587 RepID=A0A1H0YFZ2_9LACT|nr:hypothetical protein SAMN04487752_0910 [Carnobacterium viridans]